MTMLNYDNPEEDFPRLYDDVDLKPEQWDAVIQHLNGKGVIETADEIGVCRQTVSRWRQQPDYQKVLRRLQQWRRARQLHVQQKADEAAHRAVWEHLRDGDDPEFALEYLEKRGLLEADEAPPAALGVSAISRDSARHSSGRLASTLPEALASELEQRLEGEASSVRRGRPRNQSADGSVRTIKGIAGDAKVFPLDQSDEDHRWLFRTLGYSEGEIEQILQIIKDRLPNTGYAFANRKGIAEKRGRIVMTVGPSDEEPGDQP